ASVTGYHFKVEVGKAILEAAGFNKEFEFPKIQPDAKSVDLIHKKWRKNVISASRKHPIKSKEEMSEGIAAKLINVYLKVRFSGECNSKGSWAAAMHPPIDKLLLDELAKENVCGFKHQWR